MLIGKIFWILLRIAAAFYRSNSAIRMINYRPTKDMDAYLNLQNRVMSDFTMDYFLANSANIWRKTKPN